MCTAARTNKMHIFWRAFFLLSLAAARFSCFPKGSHKKDNFANEMTETAPSFGIYDCIVKPCSHGTDAPPTECARNAISHVISRRGDPLLLTETRLIAKLFRVKPLRAMCAFGVIDVPKVRQFCEFLQNHPKNCPKEVQVPMKEYLRAIGLADAAEDDPNFFETMPDEVSAAMLILFECFLRSMGLRFADADDRRLIVSDDPAIDYGYGAGDAVLRRRDGWGKCADQKEIYDFGGMPQIRATINILFSLASIGRSDLAVELLSRLMTERYAVAPVEDLETTDPRDIGPKSVQILCVHCLLQPGSPVLPRAMLSIRPLLESAVKRPDKTGATKPRECKCGFSKLIFRVRNGFRSGEITEIAACPYAIMQGRLSCKEWTVLN